MAAANPQAPASTARPMPRAAAPHARRRASRNWLAAAQYRHALRTAQAAHPLALLALTLFTLLMLEGAHMPWLMVWLCANLLLMALIMWAGHRFLLCTVRHGVAAQLRAMRWHAWLWMASGALWGSSVLLFAGQMDPVHELACWGVLAAVGMGQLYAVAAHPGMARRMLLALCGAAMSSAAWLAWTPSGAGLAGGDAPAVLPLLVLTCGLALLALAPVLSRRHTRVIERQRQRRWLIYQLQKQNHKAARALDEQSQILAGAMHDLRQPLSALSIYTDWLQTAPGMPAELAPKMRNAVHETQLMLDTLLDMARTEAEQAPMQGEWLDVAELLRALQAQAEPLAAEKGLRLRVRMPARPMRLHADRVMVLRIWRNLLFNALRYTQRGGVLVAVRRRAGGMLAFEVWDTGVGIAAADQQRLFEPFFRVRQPGHVSNARQPKALGQGVGLGLTLVQKLAQQLGGQVQVRSRLGRGSLFRVALRQDPAP